MVKEIEKGIDCVNRFSIYRYGACAFTSSCLSAWPELINLLVCSPSLTGLVSQAQNLLPP